MKGKKDGDEADLDLLPLPHFPPSDRSFEVNRSWIAFEDGRCTHLMEASGIAVTLGVSLVLQEEESLRNERDGIELNLTSSFLPCRFSFSTGRNLHSLPNPQDLGSSPSRQEDQNSHPPQIHQSPARRTTSSRSFRAHSLSFLPSSSISLLLLADLPSHRRR